MVTVESLSVIYGFVQLIFMAFVLNPLSVWFNTAGPLLDYRYRRGGTAFDRKWACSESSVVPGYEMPFTLQRPNMLCLHLPRHFDIYDY